MAVSLHMVVGIVGTPSYYPKNAGILPFLYTKILLALGIVSLFVPVSSSSILYHHIKDK